MVLYEIQSLGHRKVPGNQTKNVVQGSWWEKEFHHGFSYLKIFQNLNKIKYGKNIMKNLCTAFFQPPLLHSTGMIQLHETFLHPKRILSDLFFRIRLS